MARLFADENFPLPSVEALRSIGHDVVTLQERGLAGRGLTDAEVLATATNEGRCVLTLDRRDFVRLHSDGQVHAGIVVCTFDRDFAALGERIHEAVHTALDLSGRVLSVRRPA